MNILKRNLAPISDAAWEEIDQTAIDTLVSNLSGRKFLDLDGPHGINYSSINLGRIDVEQTKDKDLVQYGIYNVQPLVESRKIFSLNIWELDNIERGAKDVNLDSLIDAAKNIAAFEEKAVYHGFKPGKITGLHDNVSKKISMSLTNDSIVDAVAEGLNFMMKNGIKGGADFVVNPDIWKFMERTSPGGTLKNLVEKQIEGSVLYSDHVDTGLLVANRGGDTQLVVGQDFSIGYHHHTSEEVFLYLTESFSFRVITPEALVGFTLAK